MAAEQNKLLIRRLVKEAVNPGNLDVLDDIAKGSFAVAARRWAGPFRDEHRVDLSSGDSFQQPGHDRIAKVDQHPESVVSTR